MNRERRSTRGWCSKAVITTILATVVFAIFYLAQTRGLLSLDSLPFYNSLPSSI